MARKKKTITVRGSTTKKQAQKKKGISQAQSLTVNVITGRRKSSAKTAVKAPAKPPFIFSPVINLAKPENTKSPSIPPTPPPVNPIPTPVQQTVSFNIPNMQPSKEPHVKVKPVFQTEEPEYLLLQKTPKPENEIRPIKTESAYWLSLPYSNENIGLSSNQQYEIEGIKLPTKTRDMDKLPIERKNIPIQPSFETPYTYEYTPVPEVRVTIPSYMSPQLATQPSKKQTGKITKTPESMAPTPSNMIFEESEINREISRPPIEGRRIMTGIFESPNIYTEPTYPSIFTTQLNEPVDEVISSQTTASQPLQGEQKPVKSVGKITKTPSKMKPLPDSELPKEIQTNMKTEEASVPQTTPLPAEMKFIGSGTPDSFEVSTLVSPEVELSDFPVGLAPIEKINRKQISLRPPATPSLNMPETPLTIQTPESFIQAPSFRKGEPAKPPMSKRKSQATVYIPIKKAEPQTTQPAPSKLITENIKKLKSPVMTQDESLPVSHAHSVKVVQHEHLVQLESTYLQHHQSMDASY